MVYLGYKDGIKWDKDLGKIEYYLEEQKDFKADLIEIFCVKWN